MSGKIKHLQLWKGNYRVRIGVPAEFRQHLPAPHTGKSELVKGLGTASLTLAGKLAAPIVAEFYAIIDQARKPGEMVWRWIKETSPPIEFFDTEIGNTRTIPEQVGYVRHLVPVGTPEDNGFRPLDPAMVTAALTLKPQMIPAPVAPVAMKLAPVSFVAIIELWADEKQVPRKRKQAAVTLFERLAKHLGHDEAGRVTGDDLVSFKESLVQAVKHGELDPRTVQNRIEMLKTIFRWATKNHKITSNPAVDLTYLAKVDPRKERQDFTQADLRLILTEARKAANPVVRISNLIATFSGARLAEIVEANKADFEWDGGHLVFHIRLDNREEGQGLKNHTSTPRRYPLHSAIKDEVADYLRSLPANSPLFPHVKVDRDGKRSHNVGNTILKWLRKIGITDPRKVFHSHRHTFKTACRGKIDREIRNYITGHSSGDVASEYGEYPIEMLAVEIEKIANPLDTVEVAKLASPQSGEIDALRQAA
jgi:integrase